MGFKNPARSLTWPPGGTTNDPRIVAGADTPDELVAAYNISVAFLFYGTDAVTGLEEGYFYIGFSNNTSLVPNAGLWLYGAVVYPTPGDPSSATASDVRVDWLSILGLQQMLVNERLQIGRAVTNPTVGMLKLWTNGIAVANERLLDAREQSEANATYVLRGDGRTEWGAGGASSRDLWIERSTAKTLNVSNSGSDSSLSHNGVVGGLTRTWSASSNAGGTGTAAEIHDMTGDLSLTLRSGYSYTFMYDATGICSAANHVIQMRIRASGDATAPTTADTLIHQDDIQLSGSTSIREQIKICKTYKCPTDIAAGLNTFGVFYLRNAAGAVTNNVQTEGSGGPGRVFSITETLTA